MTLLYHLIERGILETVEKANIPKIEEIAKVLPERLRSRTSAPIPLGNSIGITALLKALPGENFAGIYANGA